MLGYKVHTYRLIPTRPFYLDRVHIAIPEQLSDINLFQHNFADISACVHIEKSYVGWKLTSGHNYFADIVREMASQTVM